MEGTYRKRHTHKGDIYMERLTDTQKKHIRQDTNIEKYIHGEDLHTYAEDIQIERT